MMACIGAITRISVDPSRCGGAPCIRELRIPVATVVSMDCCRASRARARKCSRGLALCRGSGPRARAAAVIAALMKLLVDMMLSTSVAEWLRNGA
jgi:hypothetical protein